MVVEAVGMIFASTFDLFRCAPGCGMVDRRGRDSPSRLLTFSLPFSGRCFLASPHPQRAFLCYHGRNDSCFHLFHLRFHRCLPRADA